MHVQAIFKLQYMRSHIALDLAIPYSHIQTDMLIRVWKYAYAHYSGLRSFDKWGP